MFNKFFRNNTALVSFMIVGAQKAGTTSLHYYLDQIEGIKGSEPKETDFFSYDSFYKNGYSFYHKKFFNSHSKGDLIFDASVEYMYLPYVAKRLFKYNPNLKIIICLREPVKRAVSAYKMYKHINSEDGIHWRNNYLQHLKNHSKKFYEVGEDFYCKRPFPSFEDLINIEMNNLSEKFNYRFYEPSLIKRGFYKYQIDNLLQYFPINQIVFLNSQKLKENPKNEVYKILNFLGLESNLEGIDFSTKLSNISNENFKPSQTSLERLNLIFQKHNTGLERYIEF